MEDLRRLAKPAPVAEPTIPLAPRQVSTIVGEPTSSLSRSAAVALAQEIACGIPDAAVATISSKYDGKMVPAIPYNCVVVIEPINFMQARPFDLVVYAAPNKEMRIRRLMAKQRDTAIVGYEFNGVKTTEVAPSAIVGRVIGTILYDPASAE